MEPDITETWIMTIEYPGVLPVGGQDDGDTGDSHVRPLAISRIGDRSTRLSAAVTADAEQAAHEVGIAGIGRWAQQIGLVTTSGNVVSLHIRATA